MRALSPRRIAVALCLALTAVPFCLTVPAGAAQQQRPRSSLVITLHDGWNSAGPVLAKVSLRCEPTGGTHVAAEQACTTLTTVNGNFERLWNTGALCPLIYQPVTVSVVGHWRKKPAMFKHSYDNQCFAATESAEVFLF
jgi:subtilisin inhibitor-like